jgi:hypothetical protein
MNKKKQIRLSRPVVYSKTPLFPTNIIIGLTNQCNQRCVFCSYKNTLPPPIQLSLEKARDFISQAYKLGTCEIGFTAINEPFLSNNLEECVSFAKEIGFEYTYLTTNGTAANKQRMEKLIAGGLDSIKFSVNAGTRKTYKEVHGRDDFERVIKNIRDTVELKVKSKKDIGIFVSFVETTLNRGESDILKSQLDGLVDEIYVYNVINVGNQVNDEIKINDKNKKVYHTSTWQGSSYSKLCDQIFNRFHITPQGFYTVCCSDISNQMVVADLNKVTLEEAWDCELAKKVRTAFLEQKIPESWLCYNCINNSNNTVEPLSDWEDQ